MKKIWIAVGVVSALSFAGCGGGEKTETKPADTSAAPAAGAGGAATPDLANGATISGKVVFDGPKPVAKTLDMSANPACMNAHKGAPPKSEEVVVNDNGTLKNAFVWVKAGLPADKTWATPTNAVELNQNGCLYQPHVIGVMVGQNVDIKNADPTNHNIHPLPANNPDYNQSQPPGAADLMHSFAREEVMVPVKCNVHNWMRAYIGVVGNPFFAVTGDDGSFSLKGLPPGTYTIQAWQEKYGTQEQTVTVAAKDTKTQDFTFKP
jgi:plastocyanin